MDGWMDGGSELCLGLERDDDEWVEDISALKQASHSVSLQYFSFECVCVCQSVQPSGYQGIVYSVTTQYLPIHL